MSATNSGDQTDKEKKLFFTTTDLVNKINTVVDREHKKANIEPGNHPRFELQRRFGDGTTRKASAEEAAAADFQSKMKQAAMYVQNLPPASKLEWAENQRQEGNKLYAKGLYNEAMDVYLTCLVAADYDNSKKPQQTKAEVDGNNTSEASNNKKNASTLEKDVRDHDDDWDQRVEKEVKLPVLLNLSQCTLKLSMYRKTCTFCDLALEMECGKTVPKVYFRRGKAKLSIGMYTDARKDLQTCLELLSKKDDRDGVKSMEQSIQKEMVKLEALVEKGEKNRVRQEKAMKRIIGRKSSPDTSNSNMQETPVSHDHDRRKDEEESLFPDVSKKREFSTLRSTRRTAKETSQKFQNQESYHRQHWAFVCCIKSVERSLRKILHYLGDEDALTKSFDSDVEEDDYASKKER